MLAALVFGAGEVVTYDRLVDCVWGDEPPTTARGSVHTYISGLRQALGPDAVIGGPTGYAIPREAVSVDENTVRALRSQADDARLTGRETEAIELLDEALSWWAGGEPLANVPGPLADAQRSRLAADRLRLMVDHAELVVSAATSDADITRVADRLTAEALRAPYDERLRTTLMQALARRGQTAAALLEYDDLRRTLRSDLGIDPSPLVQAAHSAVLAADRVPVVPAREATSGPGDRRSGPSEIPPDDQAFTGRAAELAEIIAPAERASALGTRIVSLVGIGGVGKTSLAVHASHLLRERFPDGQLYLNLRGFDPRHEPLSSAVALVQLLSSVGVTAIPDDHHRRVALWRSAVAGRRLLLLLDNAATAAHVEDLLPGAPGSMVIVTSRNRLSGLTMRHGARRVTVGPLSEEESRTLVSAAVGGEISTADQAVVSRLVRLCDGLPFALRLAAEQLGRGAYADVAELVRVMSHARSRLDVLDLEHDGVGSVRELLACSERALGEEARRLLRLFGALPVSGVTALAAAALLDVSPTRARELLAELRTQHLLFTAGDRYLMHDLTRAYAVERVVDIPDQDRTRALGRLLEWYVCTLADGLGMGVLIGGLETRYERLTLGSKDELSQWALAELPDLISLVSHAHARGHHERVWQMVVSLFPTFFTAGNAIEWLELLELGTRSAEALADTCAQAVLLNHGSVACHRIGRAEEAMRRLTRAMDLLDPEHPYQANVLSNYCWVLLVAGRVEEALPVALEAMALAARSDLNGHTRVVAHIIT
ncbi:MAG: BTAD domain-containing putative transcriptional regulator, partial [Dermatophilaceae bacterium]